MQKIVNQKKKKKKKVFTERVTHILMSAGNYFYRYIIIPATINYKNVSYIQLHSMNRQFFVLHTCTQTLFHTQHSR